MLFVFMLSVLCFMKLVVELKNGGLGKRGDSPMKEASFCMAHL